MSRRRRVPHAPVDTDAAGLDPGEQLPSALDQRGGTGAGGGGRAVGGRRWPGRHFPRTSGPTSSASRRRSQGSRPESVSRIRSMSTAARCFCVGRGRGGDDEPHDAGPQAPAAGRCPVTGREHRAVQKRVASRRGFAAAGGPCARCRCSRNARCVMSACGGRRRSGSPSYPRQEARPWDRSAAATGQAWRCPGVDHATALEDSRRVGASGHRCPRDCAAQGSRGTARTAARTRSPDPVGAGTSRMQAE